jgi:osmoprotectant transport system ATP-binding protein
MKDGEMVQVGTPEDFLKHPKNDFVKSFIGSKQSVFHLMLEDVVEEISWVEGVESAVAIDGQSTLADALELLQVHEAVTVTGASGTIGVLTRQNVLQFIYKRNLEGGTVA